MSAADQGAAIPTGMIRPEAIQPRSPAAWNGGLPQNAWLEVMPLACSAVAIFSSADL